jgi:OPA family glycerol-3-phosphate transporter-like MFS transporter
VIHENAEPWVADSPQERARVTQFTFWHGATIALLTLGYSGYYFCRSNLAVVLPELISEFAKHGLSASQAQVRLGLIASVGTVAYALGKFIFGALADVAGGRPNFLGGMAGAILFTIVFAVSGGIPLFTLAWVCNRFSQAAGWPGLVKVSSRWFSYSAYGSVMAILSLSFLFGDAACRWAMSGLLAHGAGWREVFFASAAFLGVLFIANLLLLRETPRERGLPDPIENPLNVFAGGKDENAEDHRNWVAIVRPLVTCFPFWLVCLLSVGATLLRESFNLWIPTYFVQSAGLSPSHAASSSALFPLFGGFAVLLAGVVSDRLGLNGRNLVMVLGMSASAISLLVLAGLPQGVEPSTQIFLVTLIGVLLLGPYSYLAGAMSLDFGGKRGSATAAGIIDGFGYLAGYLSGDTVARITVTFGWSGAFRALAAIAILTACIAMLLMLRQSRAVKA